jgi:hypothetical protein
MQAAEANKSSLATVVVCNPVRAIGVGNVNLNHHQVSLKQAVLRTAQDIFVLDKAFFLIEGHPSREEGFVFPVCGRGITGR